MTEYILLFALGFCASALLVLLVSPAIYRRVVTLTERRMRATVALTSSEVRAKKDAARARFAADNSILNERLKSERTKSSGLAVERERLSLQLSYAHERADELNRTISSLTDEGAALRKQLDEYRQSDSLLKSAIADAEHVDRAKDQYIQELTAKAEALVGHLEEARIDIASRDAHAEALKSRINLLRDERTSLRETAKSSSEKARDLSIRLEREEERVRALDEKLAAKVAQFSDTEAALERSLKEIERLGATPGHELPATGQVNGAEHDGTEIDALRLQLQQASEQAAIDRRQAEAKIRELEDQLTALRAHVARDQANISEFERARQEKARAMGSPSRTNTAINRRIERLRSRHAKLVNTLSEPNGDQDDAQLRDEIAEIAAMMVDLTAAREGPSSPIHEILTTDTARDGNGPISLAERARRHIDASADPDGH